MFATHTVKNADGSVVGVMVDNVFYTNQYLKQNLQYINNLYLQSDNTLVAQ